MSTTDLATGRYLLNSEQNVHECDAANAQSLFYPLVHKCLHTKPIPISRLSAAIHRR